MQVVQLLLQESPEAWKRALVIAGIAGIANAAILGIINKGASLASAHGGLVSLRLLLLFGFCLLTFYVGKRYALIQTSVVVEQMVKNTLLRVTDKIRNSDLQLVENLGRGELFTRIAQGSKPSTPRTSVYSAGVWARNRLPRPATSAAWSRWGLTS